MMLSGNSIKIIKKIYQSFIDLLFPIECLGCGAEGEWLCKICLNKIEIIKGWVCPVCKKEQTAGAVCNKCRPKSFIDGAIVAVSYSNKLIDKALHFFKYKGITGLVEPLSKLLEDVLQKSNFYNNKWLIIPVPLHKKRFRFRGYNQSELLANCISEKLNIKVENNVLVRDKYTTPQMKLARKDRLQNITGVFLCRKQLNGKNIILIDDIMTTGSTLQECAKELKKIGAGKVWGVVVARDV